MSAARFERAGTGGLAYGGPKLSDTSYKFGEDGRI